MRRYIFLILLFLFFSLHADDQELLKEFEFAPVNSELVTLVVQEADTGKRVVDLNGEKQFSFASNLKLLTAAASLEYLGGGFVFKTLFAYDRKEKTLYIKSAGDPSLVIEKMWKLAKELKKRGFRDIQKVVVDDFLYGAKPAYAADGFGKGDHAYLAHISSLGLNYNAVEITVSPSKKGQKVDVNLTTPGPHFVVENSAKTVKGAGNGLVVGSAPRGKKTVIVVKGTLGQNRTKPVKMYKRIYNTSAHYVQTLLYLMDEWSGQKIVRKKIPLAKFSAGVTYIHKSDPLRDILTIMNRYSSNFIADSLQFFMGQIIRGSRDEGVELLRQYAREHTGHVVAIINGSGLGNGHNLLTAHFFVDLLAHMKSDFYKSVDFYSTLPVMGEDGTLKRIKSDDIKGVVRAKTGSLTSVTSLSGIMKGRSGKNYIFSFAVNGYPSRSFKAMWAFRDRLIDYLWNKL